MVVSLKHIWNYNISSKVISDNIERLERQNVKLNVYISACQSFLMVKVVPETPGMQYITNS